MRDMVFVSVFHHFDVSLTFGICGDSSVLASFAYAPFSSLLTVKPSIV